MNEQKEMENSMELYSVNHVDIDDDDVISEIMDNCHTELEAAIFRNQSFLISILERLNFDDIKEILEEKVKLEPLQGWKIQTLEGPQGSSMPQRWETPSNSTEMALVDIAKLINKAYEEAFPVRER